MSIDSQNMEAFLASVERQALRMAEIATGNTEEALDLLQDSMIQLVQRYSNKPEGEWRPLFFRILQNKIRDWHRKMKLKRQWTRWFGSSEISAGNSAIDNPLENIADPLSPNPAELAETEDELKAIERALQSLPLRQQQVFLLRAWQEMSVRETASVMSCSEGSVKTHYSRAIHSLREIMEPQSP